jgi:predicted transcriptional regulator
MDERILGLAAQIVSAHVGNNNVPTEELPTLIRQVCETLSTVGKEPAQPVKPEPAVPVKRSVFEDHIVCLVCGDNFKILKRHLQTDHNLSINAYREMFSLPHDYPMVAPSYAERRSALARKIGLGRKGSASGRKGRRNERAMAS